MHIIFVDRLFRNRIAGHIKYKSCKEMAATVLRLHNSAARAPENQGAGLDTGEAVNSGTKKENTG